MTILVKTMNRFPAAGRLIRSIRVNYEGISIIVGDDGVNDESEKYATLGVKYEKFPTDAGLSQSRNHLVHLAETRYVWLMDDDFQLHDEEPDLLERLVSTLIEFNASVVGVSLDTAEMWRVPVYKACIYRGAFGFIQIPWRDPTNSLCVQTDYVRNFFLAERDFLLKNQWRAELKLGEHAIFFAELKLRFPERQAFVCYSRSIHVRVNRKKNPAGYNAGRARNKKFISMAEAIFKAGYNLSLIQPHEQERLIKLGHRQRTVCPSAKV